MREMRPDFLFVSRLSGPPEPLVFGKFISQKLIKYPESDSKHKALTGPGSAGGRGRDRDRGVGKQIKLHQAAIADRPYHLRQTTASLSAED